MGRAVLISAFLLAAGTTTAAAQQRLSLVPTGGMWQSLPYAGEEGERADRLDAAGPSVAGPSAAPKVAAPAAAGRKSRYAVRAVASAKRPRKPIAAGAAAKEPPRATAAARARELSRRIEALAPGMKLDQPIDDPANPRWRRPRASHAGPEGRAYAVPFDDSGRTGLIARGYRKDPAWNHPNGALGATFGVRARF